MASNPTKTKPAPADKRERAPHLGPERRRPLILDAALKLFVEQGYNGTSMEAIAKAAEVTKPVVYDCYAGKEELFEALLKREERRLLEAVGATFPAELDLTDPEGLMREGFTALLSAAEESPDSWRVVFDSEHGADPAIRRRVNRARASVVARLDSMIEPYLASVKVDDAARKAPVLAELLASMGEAGVRVLLASDGGWTPDELGAFLARVAARGPAGA
jgi:AcrR family transcriptional regulator